MKIVITGGKGFIGSHLAEYMIEAGYKVLVFDRYNSDNNWGWLENSKYKNDLEVILGDIRDYDSVHKAIKGCDAVFHLAALIGIPYSYVSPLAYIRTNIEGTYNVLEASKSENLEQILIASTSETYGTAQYVPINESHPLVGQSPYSATKIAADQLAISYFRSFNTPIKIVRPFNNYGPRQSIRAVIPTIISQLLQNKYEIKLGNIHPTRDFTYVKDTCSGFKEIFETNNFFGEVINIGMNDEISIRDIVYKIAKLMKKQIRIVSDERRYRPKESEVERLRCDNTKLVKDTCWKPENNIDKGLAKTIEWFKKNRHLFNDVKYNI